MLRVQSNSKRNLLNLDGFWDFAMDMTNSGEQKNWHLGIPHEKKIAIPASWNEQYQDLMYFFETGWYEKEVELPDDFQSKLIFIRIGAANYLTKVWINGEFVGEHEGAHLPFEFNITEFIDFGTKNKIVVSVDARIEALRLPPGKVEDEMIVGFKGQYPNNYYDFFPYGGIDRPVYLYTVDKTYISDIEIATSISVANGIVSYKIFLNSNFTGNVHLHISSARSVELDVVDASLIQGNFIIENARFWSPEDPYLYSLKISLTKDDKLIDTYYQDFGVRTIKIDGNKLLLNGKPIFLKGFGMHEDFAVLGKGMSHAVIVKDFNLLKWIGANSMRTSHYPYSEEFLDYADREGILVIGETPFVGFVKSHYTNKDILTKATRVINEMITRDRNHPSVIAWSLANEGDTGVPEADSFYKNLYDYAKSLDDSRPITITNCIDVKRDVALKHYDFVSINRYHGWYEQAGRLDLGCEVLDKSLDICYETFKKPVLIAEFGADAVAGMHIDPPELFSEEYQAEMVTRQYMIIESKPYTIGAHIWAFADFKTSQTPSRVLTNRKGLFTRDRQPKLAAHKVKEIWKHTEK